MKKQTIAIALIIIMALAATAHYYSLDKLVMIQSAIYQQDANWTAGITSVSHLPAEDKKYMCGARRSAPPPDAIIVSRPELHGVAAPADPPSFDWRNKDGVNWITSVKSQGICGSCWAFAALGVLEAVANIEANNPNIDPDLSEQYWVSDCYLAGDCDGGMPDHVLTWIQRYGAPLEECDEYIAANSPCVCTGWYPDGVYYSIENRRAIYPQTTENLKWALQEYGPLVVTLNVPEDWFYYRSGVYEPVWTSDEFGANGDHAVVLVGWDDAEECWFIKNSYGAGWGEDGYARVLYGNLEKYNYVYTVDGVEYPDVIPTPTPPPTPSGAQIDDDTDTLTVDKPSYSHGDVVYMTAIGTNIGDESWQGSIFFYSISPSGSTKQVYLYTLTVDAGTTESRTGTMTIPSDAEAGIWTVRSIWIDDDGVVHARTTVMI